MPQSTLLASGIILKLWHLKDICAYKEYIDTSQHSFILLYPRHSYRSFPFNGIKDNAIFEIFRNQILRLKKKNQLHSGLVTMFYLLTSVVVLMQE